jgi:prepilin-type processing-associated H-X9-DG protein
MEPQSVERTVELAAPTAAVWQALTRGEELSVWFGAQVEIDPRSGGRATFLFPDGHERDATVEVFDPERQLLLRWLPFERSAAGATTVQPAGHIRFLLESHESHTLLKVIETFFGEERAMTMAGQRQGSTQ